MSQKGSRIIFRLKGDEKVGCWIGMQNEEFYTLFSSPNVISIIKSRSIGWTGDAARLGEKEKLM
jgi:hypothetical protein